ncbi:MAG TPA: hypothetical protein DD670_03690 [Planctomycetaceae bacterium]|nr:hypothetical protein [Planctomycetaceae bacterium]
MKSRSKSILLLLGLCAISVVAMSVRRVYLRHAGVSGYNVTASMANRMIWPELRLPAGASDVSYYVDFGRVEAEFAISGESLVEWCRSNGWTCEPIDSQRPYFEPWVLPGDSRSVANGYRFFPPDGDGIYDADRSRACFWVSNFP